jgi:hypothetical protein
MKLAGFGVRVEKVWQFCHPLKCPRVPARRRGSDPWRIRPAMFTLRYRTLQGQCRTPHKVQRRWLPWQNIAVIITNRAPHLHCCQQLKRCSQQFMIQYVEIDFGET